MSKAKHTDLPASQRDMVATALKLRVVANEAHAEVAVAFQVVKDAPGDDRAYFGWLLSRASASIAEGAAAKAKKRSLMSADRLAIAVAADARRLASS